MAKSLHIELEDVRKLGALQCSEKEAAAFFGCTVTRFKKILEDMPEVFEAWEAGREGGKISLRRKQFRLASTSATMAIHLGKNLLGQKDIVVNEHTGKDGGPIQNLDLNQLNQDERNKLRSILQRARRPESGS